MLQGSAFFASSLADPTKFFFFLHSHSHSLISLLIVSFSLSLHFTPFFIPSFLFLELSKTIGLPIMGKEWYFAGRSTSKRGVGGGNEGDTQAPSGCMCAVFQFFDFHPFHFPNINHQQHHEQTTSFKPPSSTSQDHTTVPKGAEAPRNSLESEDGDGTISSLSSKEDDFKIPKNIIQIKTCGGTRASGGNDLSSDISNSPGTKTPTLVARLMGLDLLPHSPSFSSSLSTPNTQSNVPHLHHMRHKQQQQQHVQTKHRNSIDCSEFSATRSLPETPRISLARRSDVDYHHRLSLQVNKENMNLGEDLDLPRLSFSKRSRCDENYNNNGRSPSHYARQIVKQVKESVSRKVGQDITNTLKTREEIVGQFRSKKSHKTSPLKAIDETETNTVKLNSNSSSYSPRIRLIDNHNHKPSTNTTTTTTTTATPSPPLTTKDQNMLKLPPPPPPVNTTQLHIPRFLTAKPKPQAVILPEQQEFHQNKKSVPKCKKATNEKFNSRIKRLPKKQEESFVLCPTSPASDIKNTKTKKTHSLSSNVPNLLPVKSDPSPPATKLPSKQVCDSSQESKSSSCSQLSSCSSHQRYKQEGTTTLATQEISDNKPNGASSTTATHPQVQYITAILARTTALNKQGTPLDPSIFHHLEHSVNDKDRNFIAKDELGHRWNRKLLFDLVDEVLVGILGGKRRRREKKLWFLKGICYDDDEDDDDGSVEGLVERVWKRVGEFPSAKCEVLEDIDGLIEGMEREKDCEGIEEEGKEVVAEIEENIWNTLVHETIMGSEKLLYSEKIISVHDFD